MAIISLELWQNPNFPSLEILESRTKAVLEAFNKCRKIDIKLNGNDSKIKRFNLLFNSLTERRAVESYKLSMYSEDVVIYMKSLSEENISVGVILETLSSLLNTAQDKHEIAEKLKNDYQEFLEKFKIGIGDDSNNRQVAIRNREAEVHVLHDQSFKSNLVFMSILASASILVFYSFSIKFNSSSQSYIENNGKDKEDDGINEGKSKDSSGNDYDKEGKSKDSSGNDYDKEGKSKESSGNDYDKEGKSKESNGNGDQGNDPNAKDSDKDFDIPKASPGSSPYLDMLWNFLFPTSPAMENGYNSTIEENECNSTLPAGCNSTLPECNSTSPAGCNSTSPEHNSTLSNDNSTNLTSENNLNSYISQYVYTFIFGVIIFLLMWKFLQPKLYRSFMDGDHERKSRKRLNETSNQQIIEKDQKIFEIKEKIPVIIESTGILSQFWENQIINIKAHIESLRSVNENQVIKVPKEIAEPIKENWNNQSNESKINYVRMKDLVTRNSLLTID